MKLVPYTVAVPQQCAVLMKEIGKLLPEFELDWATLFFQMIGDFKDDEEGLRNCVETAIGSHTFRTKEEKGQVESAVLAAYRRFLNADPAVSNAEMTYLDESEAA